MGDAGADLRLRRERDLYLRLLDLGAETEIDPFLDQALQLIAEIVGARQGYVELHDPRDDASRWSTASGFSEAELADVRSRVSRGIIAEALATGSVVETASALLDERFSGRESVRGERIEAVLCTPIGSDPPLGVLYLQGRTRKGPFGEEDRACAETFARHLAPLADAILIRHASREGADPTRPHRRQLRVEGLLGRSEALASLLREISLVAPLEVSVLLTGETGTGKSLVARVIHENGPRSRQAFVELNCAAFPETLIESELFGALPGSHSTATQRVPGKVSAAEKGTLFLDEVGELSTAAQAKLLQLLQDHTYYPLGATAPVQADVRVIAATNVDLEAEVAAGRFRADLFYRLRVLPLRVPSLAERRIDIAPLARYFCEAACERHRLPRVSLSAAALRALEAAEWPGNVRELAHAVEAASIRAAGERSPRAERRHVFPDEGSSPEDDGEGPTFQEATRRFQRGYLRQALEDTEWNVSETARRLDLSRSHLYNLVNAFGLRRDRD